MEFSRFSKRVTTWLPRFDIALVSNINGRTCVETCFDNRDDDSNTRGTASQSKQ